MAKNLTFIHTADLHQGFEFSERKWKSGIRQRSDDFLDNFMLIINRAKQSDIDFLVLAGDIFNRSKPPPAIRHLVLDKLCKLSLMKPVFIIPGNHDKSRIKKGLMFLYPNMFIFNSPTNRQLIINDIILGITAVPFVRENTLDVISSTINNKSNISCDFSLLILHELIESSKVGYMNFEFKKNMPSVVPIETVDKKFDYIALGHVHKFQKIDNTNSCMFYSGSVERTSVVEKDEIKGYLTIKVEFSDDKLYKKIIPKFIPLPTRSMIYLKISTLSEINQENFITEIKEKISISDKPPIVLLNIANLDEYSLYKSIKSFLKELKANNDIFLYGISSPNFRRKLDKISTSPSNF